MRTKNSYQSKPTLRIFLRPKRNKESVRTHLCFRLYYNKKASNDVSLKMKVSGDEKWNAKTAMIEYFGKDRDTANEVSHKNAILTQLKADSDEIFYTLRHRSRRYTVGEFADFLIKKRSINDADPNVLRAYGLYIEQKAEEAEAGLIAQLRVKRIQNFKGVFAEFLKEKYSLDIRFEELKPIIGNDFNLFLSKRKYGTEYRKKHIQLLITVIKFAVANEWATRNVLDTYKMPPVSKKEISYLTAKEIRQIDDVLILAPALEQVRDIFIFSCWTGCAYADLKALQPSHLFETTEGIWAIKKPREKTAELAVVPLAPRAIEIMQKYKSHCDRTGNLLPVLSNAKSNAYLKALASLVGISRVNLTMHVARKSFATMLLNENVPLDIVASAVGHSNSKTTAKFYAQMQEETVVRTVNEAFIKMNQRTAV